MRALLSLQGESERLGQLAKLRESQSGRISPRLIEEFLRPHCDIMGAIIKEVKTDVSWRRSGLPNARLSGARYQIP